MLVFAIRTLVGVGPITFGMPRSEVRGILADIGQPEATLRFPNTDCFFQNCFQVSYDDDGRVDFIETAASTEFLVLFRSQSLHELAADEAVRLVSELADYDKAHPEHGYSYIFPALELCLWRPVMPSGTDDSEGRHFEAVGAGKKGYYSSQWVFGATAAETVDGNSNSGDEAGADGLREPPAGLEWLAPWSRVEEGGEELAVELHRELPPEHFLQGHAVAAVARNGDDVLFATADAGMPLAVVHLTWSGRVESVHGIPSTSAYANWEDWWDRCLLADHQTWVDSEYDFAEAIAVLKVLRANADHPDTDVTWAGYESVAELLAGIDRHIAGLRARDPSAREDLAFLFLPTCAFQELAISNGWGKEFLALARRMDRALALRISDPTASAEA